MSCHFSEPASWCGGFYELAIEMGPARDPRLEAALTRLWSYPGLYGCYERNDREPSAQARVSPVLLPEPGSLYGVATIGPGSEAAVGTCSIREEPGSDWLVFYLPIGSLGHAFSVGAYPTLATPTAPPWQAGLDLWLFSLAEHVFAGTPFALALIGFEVSGDLYAEQLRHTGIPDSRHFGIAWPTGGRLKYHPPTLW